MSRESVVIGAGLGLVFGLMCGGALGSVVDPMHGLSATSVELDSNGDNVYWFDVDISGATFYDGLGSAMNQVMDLGNDPFYDYILIAKIRWDIGISTVGNSWLSEASMEITTNGNSHTLTPGVGMDFPGDEWFQDEVDLFAMGNHFFVMDGVRVEFFESFDDVSCEADAFAMDGSTLSFGLVAPAPGGVGLLMCAGLIGVRRRR